MRTCRNCGKPVYVPDDRVGLVHVTGRYGCEDKRGKVAE